MTSLDPLALSGLQTTIPDVSLELGQRQTGFDPLDVLEAGGEASNYEREAWTRCVMPKTPYLAWITGKSPESSVAIRPMRSHPHDLVIKNSFEALEKCPLTATAACAVAKNGVHSISQCRQPIHRLSSHAEVLELCPSTSGQPKHTHDQSACYVSDCSAELRQRLNLVSLFELRHRRARAGHNTTLQCNNVCFAGSVSDLGTQLLNQGDLCEAEHAYLYALAEFERALGPDHTSTLDVVHNLGILYSKQAMLHQAEQMYKRALSGYEQARGLKHTSTLDIVHNLGVLYHDQGELDAAQKMYRRAVIGYEKALGPSHTSTLDTMHSLGILYHDRGKLGAAEWMYRRAISGYTNVLRVDHPSRLRVVNDLGSLYRRQGKTQAAERLLGRCATERNQLAQEETFVRPTDQDMVPVRPN